MTDLLEILNYLGEVRAELDVLQRSPQHCDKQRHAEIIPELKLAILRADAIAARPRGIFLPLLCP